MKALSKDEFIWNVFPKIVKRSGKKFITFDFEYDDRQLTEEMAEKCLNAAIRTLDTVLDFVSDANVKEMHNIGFKQGVLIGVIGAIGGAVAGIVIGDILRKKKEEKEEGEDFACELEDISDQE